MSGAVPHVTCGESARGVDDDLLVEAWRPRRCAACASASTAFSNSCPAARRRGPRRTRRSCRPARSSRRDRRPGQGPPGRARRARLSWRSPPEDAPPNRLGLARWMVSPDPARRPRRVNRLWEMVFGAGLVRTSEDFGQRGELPTHPELARLARRRVPRVGAAGTSATCSVSWSPAPPTGQASAVRAELADRDPENRLLASLRPPPAHRRADPRPGPDVSVACSSSSSAARPSRPTNPRALAQECIPACNTREFQAHHVARICTVAALHILETGRAPAPHARLRRPHPREPGCPPA